MTDGDFPDGGPDGGGLRDGTDDGRVSAARHVTAIERYWSRVRGRRLVPTRADIDPRGMTGSLSHAFVLERISMGLARFRISGSHLTDLLGLEARGMPISTIFTPGSRETLSDAIACAFDDPSLIRLDLNAEVGFGRPPLTGKMTLLPLRSDLGEISRLLGGLEMNEQIGRAPRRLEIVGQSREGLVGLGEPQLSFRSDDQHSRIKARTPKPMSGSTAQTQRHLRLVVDNS